jgi:radical SAM protein with 4Fe4S-binding SPASM domain
MFKFASRVSTKLKPICAVWELTLKCNSKCIHCGSNAGEKRSGELNNEEALNLVRELKSCGFKGVALMGGEPLLRSDWFEIANEVKKNNLELSIVTNGLTLKENIHKIKSLGTDCVSISLDAGTEKVHDYLRGVSGSFSKVIEALNILERTAIPTSIITSVSKINLKEIDKIKKMIIDRNIAWQIQVSTPIGRFPKKLMIDRTEFYNLASYIANTVKKYGYKRVPLIGAHCLGHYSRFIPNLGLSPWIGCQAGKTILGIQCNGNIKGCLTLPDSFIEGNIREEKLSIILKRLRMKTLEPRGYCQKCDVLESCMGGCLGTALAVNEFEYPYCLRAIENEHFLTKFPLTSKVDTIFSKIKNYYEGLSKI